MLLANYELRVYTEAAYDDETYSRMEAEISAKVEAFVEGLSTDPRYRVTLTGV